MSGLVYLNQQAVEKPWGCSSIEGWPEFDGRRVGELWFEHPDRHLPVLVKWLFTSERLSIQVHPDDPQARARGLLGGKEECWVVTHAAPDAVLGIGTRHELTHAQLRSAALSGDLEELMEWHSVQAGDWFHIPPGTVHAIGAGISLVEIQQNHDITYRLYDYGRPRALHLDDGIAVSIPAPYTDPRCGRLPSASTLSKLTSCAHFEVFLGCGYGYRSVPSSDCWLIPLKGHVYCNGKAARRGDVLYGSVRSAADPSEDFLFLCATTRA